MRVRESHALRRELVEVRCGDFGSRVVATEITIAEIVSVKNQHIGVLIVSLRRVREGDR